MIKQRTGLILFVLLASFFHGSSSFDDDVDNDLQEINTDNKRRVDAGVRRPYRICQGFEDPDDVDCYLRSDVKNYVCTEPASFNPCESKRRVTTYHYDHIKHRCDVVSVPACSGQIIRAMTLIQCLIYCHNKDPYALGKSTSVVFKLNQKKPFIPKDGEVDVREKAKEYVNNVEFKSAMEKSVANSIMDKNDDELADKFVKIVSGTNDVIGKDSNVKETVPETGNEITGKMKKIRYSDGDNNVLSKESKKSSFVNEKKVSTASEYVKPNEKNLKVEDGKEVKAIEKKESKTSELVKPQEKNLKITGVKEVKAIEKKESKLSKLVKPQEKNLKVAGDKDVKAVEKKESKPSELVKPQEKNFKVTGMKDVKAIEKKESKTSELVKPQEKDLKVAGVRDVKAIEKKESKTSELVKPQEKDLKVTGVKKENLVEKKKLTSMNVKIVKKEDIGKERLPTNRKEMNRLNLIKSLETIVQRELMDMKSQQDYKDETKKVIGLEETNRLQKKENGKDILDEKTFKEEENNLVNFLRLQEKKKINKNPLTRSIDSEKEERELFSKIMLDITDHDKDNHVSTKSDQEILHNLIQKEETNQKKLAITKKELDFSDEEDLPEKKSVDSPTPVEKVVAIVKSDSNDKSNDDGFYLWDE